MAIKNVLVIDDEPDIRELLEITLGRMDLNAVSTCDVASAKQALERKAFDLCLTDMRLPDGDGLDIVKFIQAHYPGLPVAVITAYGNVEAAVLALKSGAFDYVSKPVDLDLLRRLVQAALKLTAQSSATTSTTLSPKLLGESTRIKKLQKTIFKVARSQAPLYIHGESGSGKELVADEIHNASPRSDQAFIAINCGAIPAELMESEFFGHKKGSFTGAAGRRKGVFEMADKGTLFLDELGETSQNVQVNLLRVLEEMCFRRVGGHDLVNVDTRIVAATHADLERKTHEGAFREDLFYRLNVFPIHLPPLRERPEDIPLLARHFLSDAAKDYELETPELSPEAMLAITAHRWPGNVRQLRALCERWVIVAAGRTITLDLLPPNMQPGASRVDQYGTTPLLTIDENVPMKHAVGRAAIQVERTYLHRLLRRHNGHLINTAKAAGITRRTLYTKMKLYGLDAADYRRA